MGAKAGVAHRPLVASGVLSLQSIEGSFVCILTRPITARLLTSFGACLSCRVTDEKAEIEAQIAGQHMALKLNDHSRIN